MLPAENVTGRTYRVAHTYIDKGNPHLDGDEFSGWLAIDKRTIGMVGGIRHATMCTGSAHPAMVSIDRVLS